MCAVHFVLEKSHPASSNFMTKVLSKCVAKNSIILLGTKGNLVVVVHTLYHKPLQIVSDCKNEITGCCASRCPLTRLDSYHTLIMST